MVKLKSSILNESSPSLKGLLDADVANHAHYVELLRARLPELSGSELDTSERIIEHSDILSYLDSLVIHLGQDQGLFHDEFTCNLP